MGKPQVFIDGEAGTTGLHIRARLAGRNDVTVVSVDPARRKDESERRRLLNSVDLAILCLPDAAAKDAVALIENPDVRVLDASTAHRTDPDWVYGFPELAPEQAQHIADAKRVANPGCYPTGTLALLRPLVEAGLLPAAWPIAIHAVSGYSGGGRQMVDDYEGRGSPGRGDSYFAYGLDLAHKHRAEMAVHAGLTHTPMFAPAVGAFRQGMLIQIALPLWSLPGKISGPAIHQSLADRYAGQKFVHVMPLGDVPARLIPEGLNGTNLLELYVFHNPADETALLMARLDNLGKGASGAAVQNMDVMLGLTGDHDYALDPAHALAAH